MIEKGILPKDTTLTPVNPMPADVAAKAPGDSAENGACESLGKARLFVDDTVVAEGPLRT